MARARPLQYFTILFHNTTGMPSAIACSGSCSFKPATITYVAIIMHVLVALYSYVGLIIAM